MADKLQKQDMIPGKQYKGYAWFNEYMELFFRPAAEGSRAGRIKKVCADDNYTLSTTTNFVMIHIKFPKQDSAMGYISALTKVVDKLISAFLKYEI